MRVRTERNSLPFFCSSRDSSSLSSIESGLCKKEKERRVTFFVSLFCFASFAVLVEFESKNMREQESRERERTYGELNQRRNESTASPLLLS
jgi:hypothetical protein